MCIAGFHTPMLTHMPGFPCKHRLGLDSGTDLRRDIKQIGVDFAAMEHAIKKRPLVRCQIEQNGESFSAKRNVLLNPRVGFFTGGKPIAGQTDCELLVKFARIALDSVDRQEAGFAQAVERLRLLAGDIAAEPEPKPQPRRPAAAALSAFSLAELRGPGTVFISTCGAASRLPAWLEA